MGWGIVKGVHCPILYLQPHAAIEHLECDWSESGYIINVKYTSYFIDLVQKKGKYYISNFILITS